MRRALYAVLALLALASAGAGGVRAADDDTLGAVVQSRVYLDEGDSLLVQNRGDVDAVFSFEPTGGWSIGPAELVLAPGEMGTAVVGGGGEDGAAYTVLVTSAAQVPDGAQRSVLSLGGSVWYERPLDWWPLVLGGALALAGLALLGLLSRRAVRRRRAADAERSRWLARIEGHAYGR